MHGQANTLTQWHKYDKNLRLLRYSLRRSLNVLICTSRFAPHSRLVCEKFLNTLMSSEKHLEVSGFEGYELLDSGEHMKLERFGDVILSRPDTQAIWKKSKPELWKNS